MKALYKSETPYDARHLPKASLGLLPAPVDRLRRRPINGILMAAQGQEGFFGDLTLRKIFENFEIFNFFYKIQFFFRNA